MKKTKSQEWEWEREFNGRFLKQLQHSGQCPYCRETYQMIIPYDDLIFADIKKFIQDLLASERQKAREEVIERLIPKDWKFYQLDNQQAELILGRKITDYDADKNVRDEVIKLLEEE